MIVAIAELGDHIGSIRRQGYAISDQELMIGL